MLTSLILMLIVPNYTRIIATILLSLSRLHRRHFHPMNLSILLVPWNLQLFGWSIRLTPWRTDIVTAPQALMRQNHLPWGKMRLYHPRHLPYRLLTCPSMLLLL